MTAQPSAHHGLDADLTDIRRFGDLILYQTLFAWALGALAIGHEFGDLSLACGVAAALLGVGSVAFFTLRGSRLAQALLTTCNVAFVALHIQLGRGTIEFHFGVFVLLGLLLVYRDWRPIVLAAGLFAVHHVAFDRMQALNLGVFCTPQANFLKTAMHALYVVAQTGVEIFLAIQLRQAAVEGAELTAMLRSVDRGEALCLDVKTMPASSPTARILKSTLGKMEAAMQAVRKAAASIEHASAEIANGNRDLSQRTEEQASNLQQTSSSMVQLTSTVRNTADTASQANLLAGQASDAATAGGAAVGKVISTMTEISHSSKRISEIIGVIDGIAFQTNILALNAAVEAARAGEHGRGFSVVAAEVRLLAQRSAGAAKEIKSLISESVDRVEAGTRLVGAAGSSMDNIVAQARRVSELIGEISYATGEQTVGLGHVGDSVTLLDQVTQQNSALVEQSAAATDGLKYEAIQLNTVVNRFVLA